MNGKRLTRDLNNKMISGVCSGIANYMGIDPTVARVIFVLLALGFGSGILAYIIMAIVIPAE